MGRQATDPGRWGRITLVPETRSKGGRWTPVPEASRRSGDPRRWPVAPQRWRATARVRDADDGKLRQVSRYGDSKTKAEALLRKDLEARQSNRTNRAASPARCDVESLASAAASWLSEARERLAGSSYDTYRQTLRRHVAPSPLGAAPLVDVRPAAVNELLLHVLQQSGPGAAKLVRSVLNGTFERAIGQDVIQNNPVRQAGPIRSPRRSRPVEGERDTRRALTREDRDRLIDFADSDGYCRACDLADLIAFMAGTGVRVGEAIALQWRNLELDESTPIAIVAATVSRVTGQGNRVQTSTKTGRDRVIYLPEWLASRLRSRREGAGTCPPLAPVFGTAALGSGPSHGQRSGQLRDRSNTTKQLRRVYDAAGLPWMTSHTLRRTAASLLDDAGLPLREVSGQLGHSDLRTTFLYLDRRRATTRAADVL